jgi:predicted dehydrogenase
VAEAERLAEAAERRGVVLSVNTQYVAAAEAYRAFLPEALASGRSFRATMTSQRKPDGPRGRAVWLDLAPHPLSILLALRPEARLEAARVAGRIEPDATDLAFTVVTDGLPCRAEVRVAKLPQPPFPRSFGFGDHAVEYGGEPDAAGVYRGFLRHGDGTWCGDDFMRTSLARFCAAVRGQGPPLTTAAAAVRTLRLLLELLDAAEHGGARVREV